MDAPRNYLTEAVAILEKKTGMICQREHLEAIAKEHAQAVANGETLSNALAALLSHTPPAPDGTHGLPIHGRTVRAMRARMPVVLVRQTNKDDPDEVVVTMRFTRTLAVAGPRRVQ